MKSGYCPKCKQPCEVSFVSHVIKNGKVIYPKKGKRCLVIPHCDNCNK